MTFKKTRAHPRLSREERQLYWSGRTPAWLRYRIAHRLVRVAMRDSKRPTDIYTSRADGEWQIKIFVLRAGDVSVGFCYGKLAAQMRKTFWPRGVQLEVMQPDAWERIQAHFVSDRRYRQRRAVRKEIS